MARKEELKMRGEGKPYGPYKWLSLGGTTLNALAERGLIPPRDYEGHESRKPDALIIDDRVRPTRVVASIEYKDDMYKDSGISQAATIGGLIGARFCVSTDNDRSFWFLSDAGGAHRPILDETGHNYATVFISPDASVKQALIDIAREAVLEVDVRLEGDRIVPERTLNPSALARSVWQDIYTAGDHPTPERALATFVEIFMFKFLSDLGVLRQNQNGHDLSFDAVRSRDKDKCLRYYASTVRPYIREQLFPPGEDGTTIINGFAFDPDNVDHNFVFHKVLRKFKDFENDREKGGKLLDIDKEFKSRLFEEFLKGSVGQRSLGQFFTPRRLMGGIVDMAEVEKLPDGAKMCDPACGVGGFPMEASALRAKRTGQNDFRLVIEKGKPRIVSRIDYHGFDKGSNQTESLAIILAKANFVIYQSDLLRGHPEATRALAHVFNQVFKAFANSALGSLDEIKEGIYDLILSNPPYVASGVSNLRDAAGRARVSYAAGGKGVEAMFVEKMIRELKVGGRAFIIIPDGLLLRTQSADRRFRAWISKNCHIDGIVSVPVKTFFATPKKTYVLALTKKQASETQRHPVFAYLVTSIGETLDAGRFPTNDSDMPEMARRFRQAVAGKAYYEDNPPTAVESMSSKAKQIPAQTLIENPTWDVDRFWSKAEKVALGLHEESSEMSADEFFDELRSIKDRIEQFLSEPQL